MPGELEPPASLAGKHARDLQDQSGESRNLAVPMPDEGPKASNIPGRDNGLVRESMQLVQAFDAIALFARQALALFTRVDAMATPAELLIRARPTADAAMMSHARRESYCVSALFVVAVPSHEHLAKLALSHAGPL